MSRVIGQDGANTLPNAESRVGMGAGSIKSASMDVIKILIIVTLFAIVFSLGSALFHMSRGKGDSKKMARALTIRVGSVGGALHSVNAGLVQRPHYPPRRHPLMGSGPIS